MVNTTKKTIDDKTVVKEYFNATGFERWRNIYGEGKVNKVQLDIRQGHQQTIDTVVSWLKDDGNLSQLSICDAGCGVGSLTLPLAQEGATVYASDISAKMVGEAAERIKQVMKNPRNIRLGVQDLESIRGSYDTVICLDVLIHYPTEDAAKMINHLSSLTKSRLILSFAPKTFFLTLLKRIGEFFPGPSKTTRAYQHKEEDIVKILQDNGFQIKRTGMTSTSFYYSRILEAVR
ncbi:magnesium protoporphyrin IX methyltransferase [Cyanobacterium aponinum AL20118]|uniref:Magnesium protoporphyrin IX methyltransferase n=3 Tax=Cyanobacterium aponinum TaxID=379064 RepID=K9Z718_CYAAP|nr:magnesium protoporphyrin IX methyltransferase [Cyanobacterium aponinum]AFZ54537.1 magnesium protoporphyrin O-methyltransferase [Cyanobacterium aponinum PCC 10605]MBD2394689.1 magnesium protoporphyrin IX methyltransferase [Cyanobacterium aponinum FACHB-4101]MTF40181.1 magnesium protoporphyrin IX methyltransferase [Cyanobacterium aponinum 0216]PHV63790.1 magnesium protoporphyrin IX methyltransferase [Cyanobacterium aponinum IPPAS B-1201]WPF88063.1 magnesium protoporphyrin IX methyltransferase